MSMSIQSLLLANWLESATLVLNLITLTRGRVTQIKSSGMVINSPTLAVIRIHFDSTNGIRSITWFRQFEKDKRKYEPLYVVDFNTKRGTPLNDYVGRVHGIEIVDDAIFITFKQGSISACDSGVYNVNVTYENDTFEVSQQHIIRIDAYEDTSNKLIDYYYINKQGRRVGEDGNKTKLIVPFDTMFVVVCYYNSVASKPNINFIVKDSNKDQEGQPVYYEVKPVPHVAYIRDESCLYNASLTVTLLNTRNNSRLQNARGSNSSNVSYSFACDLDEEHVIMTGTVTFSLASQCEVERMQGESQRDLLGVFIPFCTDRGYYAPRQCYPSIGQCWCVDSDGNEIPNTRARSNVICGGLTTEAGGLRTSTTYVSSMIEEGVTSHSKEIITSAISMSSRSQEGITSHSGETVNTAVYMSSKEQGTTLTTPQERIPGIIDFRGITSAKTEQPKVSKPLTGNNVYDCIDGEGTMYKSVPSNCRLYIVTTSSGIAKIEACQDPDPYFNPRACACQLFVGERNCTKATGLTNGLSVKLTSRSLLADLRCLPSVVLMVTYLI